MSPRGPVPSRRVRWRGAVAAALLPLALAACSSATPTAPGGGGGGLTVDVDVDTPDLRAQKKAAGVEDCPAPAPGRSAAGEDALPDVILPCLGGGPDVNLADLRGPAVINLWAQWCGPCREELPYYQQLHERAGDRVQVLGVDYQDTQPSLALDLVEQTGVTYPLVADPGAQVRVPFKVRGLPGVVFVDEDGAVTHVEYVVVRSYDQLADLVEEHLGVSVAG